MTDKILILGGYGNFGKRIATVLAAKGFSVVIAGRNGQKARQLAKTLGGNATIAVFDINVDLPQQLQTIDPGVVVNTCGPFQTSNYNVAIACIDAGIHYIDLADGRAFVTGITRLDQKARQAGISAISGASTVPGLSSAVVENFLPEFSHISRLDFGISPGHKAERGLATTKGIMTYVGRPLKPPAGTTEMRYGWQDIHRQCYPELGNRWMANCEIPDLDLFPARYRIGQIRFSAGLELTPLHLGLWSLSWLVRAGLPLNLPALAKPVLSISNWFNLFGSAAGGMHMIMSGKDIDGRTLIKKWFIIAKDGDGPHIPTVPAIVLTKKLLRGDKLPTGAMPCLGLVSLEEALAELKHLNVKTYTE